MGQVKKISFIDDGAHTTFVSGVFNILHPGHRRFLDFAASKKKHLVIGVFSDSFAGEKAICGGSQVGCCEGLFKKSKSFFN